MALMKVSREQFNKVVDGLVADFKDSIFIFADQIGYYDIPVTKVTLEDSVLAMSCFDKTVTENDITYFKIVYFVEEDPFFEYTITNDFSL